MFCGCGTVAIAQLDDTACTVELNDIGHDIAGGEHDGARLDLAIICEPTLTERPAASNATASASNNRAPRASAVLSSPCASCIGIGIGRARRDDRTGTREAEAVEQHGMVEKIAGQAGALAQPMLFEQLAAAFARRKIQRILVAHVAGNAEPPDQRFQAGDGIEAGAIGARGALEAVDFAQFAQRPVDFPQQHGGGGRRAAAAGQLAIDDDDVEALPRQAFGDQRSGDAGADNQRIAFEVFADFAARRMCRRRKPRRTAAAQVGLFGIV